MEIIKVASIPRTYKNNGQHAEQALCYTLTGEIRKADKVPFDKASDIPEYAISVKSSRFTLASAKANFGDTFEEKLTDFVNRVHSTRFAYVSLANMVAYVMNIEEFADFVRNFCTLAKESTSNGGGMKIRCKKESKTMIDWLEALA